MRTLRQYILLSHTSLDTLRAAFRALSANFCAHLREMEHVCGFEGCVKPSKYAALLMCSGCRVARYCDVGCQKAAWRVHKGACRAGAAELFRTQLVPVGKVRAVPADVLQAEIALLRVMAAQRGRGVCVGRAVREGQGRPARRQGRSGVVFEGRPARACACTVRHWRLP